MGKKYTLEAEIVATGTWTDMNGETVQFTEADLAQIAENFTRLSDRHRPPLKLGHNEEQPMTDGAPALGWVSALRVAGNKLLATFSDLPQVVYDAIKAKRYSRVSSEIFFTVRDGTEEIGKVLRAVALLGADLPAINNLADLNAYLSAGTDGNPIQFSGGVVAQFAVNDGTIQQQVETMDDKNKLPAEDVGVTAQERQELAELRQFKAEQAVKEQRQKEEARVLAFTQAKTEALSPFKQQVDDGRLAPAVYDQLETFANAQQSQFKTGDQIVVPLSTITELLTKFSVQLPTGEQAGDKSQPSGIRADKELYVEARKVMLNQPDVPYLSAVERVLQAQPELAQRYVKFTAGYARQPEKE